MRGREGSQGIRSTTIRTALLYILALFGTYSVISVLLKDLPLRASSVGSTLRNTVDRFRSSLRKLGRAGGARQDSNSSMGDSPKEVGGGLGRAAGAGDAGAQHARQGGAGDEPLQREHVDGGRAGGAGLAKGEPASPGAAAGGPGPRAEAGGDGGGGGASPSGSAPGRWRGNDYVNEDGILPYQRCGASDFSPGPRPLFGVVKYNGTRFDQVVLGATVWGEADSTGKPTRVDTVQLLFFTQSQENKCESVHYAAHCFLPDVLPTMSCRIRGQGAPWRKAYREQRVLDTWSTLVGRQNVASDPVHCPFPGGVEALADRFEVELKIGGDDREGVEEPTMVVDMCYSHVAKASDVTICTQPQFMYSAQAGYWAGRPPYSNYTILDSFLLYHMELQGTSLAVYDVQTSVEQALEPYRADGRVVYRPGWGLYEIQRKQPDKPYNPYGYQTHCETACFWEQRIRARWVFFLHSADCYVLPSAPGESLVSLLRSKVNRTEVSEIRIPTVEAHSPPDKPLEGNIVTRFSLLGRGGLLKQKRFTPLGNPRHYDTSNVHVFTANHSTAKASLGTRECIFDLGLRTIHIYAAARSNADSHKGRADSSWIQIGYELEALLARDYPRRAKYRESINATA